jgi:hypothetical protein
MNSNSREMLCCVEVNDRSSTTATVRHWRWKAYSRLRTETWYEKCKLCGTEKLEVCWLFCLYQLLGSTWLCKGNIRSSSPNSQFLSIFTNRWKHIIFTHIYTTNTWEFQSLYCQTIQHENVLDYQTTRMKQIHQPTLHTLNYCQTAFTKFIFMPL